MTQKQFEELIKTLKGIESALLALRVPNVVCVPNPPYVTTPPPVYPSPVYIGDLPVYPSSLPIITCETITCENTIQETQHVNR